MRSKRKFLKIVRSRYLIGGLCLLAAAMVAFLIVPNIYRNQEATATVVRAAVDIPVHTLLAPEMLETVEVGAYNLPANVIRESAVAIGQYAAVELQAGDMLTTAKLEAAPGDSLLSEAVSDGLYMVTITLPSIAAALATQMQPGDYVAVATYSDRGAEDAQWEIATDENGEQIVVPQDTEEDFGVTLHPELAHLQIYAVSDSSGADATITASVPKSVTFLVNKTQAELLVKAEYEARVHLIWKGRGRITDPSASANDGYGLTTNAIKAAGPAGWKGRGSIERQ